MSIGETEIEGYLPHDLGIGGGDDVDITVCLDCGQLQGTWPLPESKLELKSKKQSKVYTPPEEFADFCQKLINYVKYTNSSNPYGTFDILVGDGKDVGRVAAGINSLVKSEWSTMGGVMASYCMESDMWDDIKNMLVDYNEDEDEDEYNGY